LVKVFVCSAVYDFFIIFFERLILAIFSDSPWLTGMPPYINLAFLSISNLDRQRMNSCFLFAKPKPKDNFFVTR